MAVNVFNELISFMFGWLPNGLWMPLYLVVAAAILIVVVKVLIALVQVLSKVVLLFLSG